MNDENLKSRIESRFRRHDRGRGNVWTGLFLLTIGGLLLARAAGVFFPSWFFTWPLMLMALGLFLGLRHGFKGGAWLILIIIGAIFLTDKMTDTINLRPYLWPIVLMVAGTFIMLKPRHRHYRKRFDFVDDDKNYQSSSPAEYQSATPTTNVPSTESFNTHEGKSDFSDVVDITAIFAGVKKKILSKNFKGGDIVSIMGGTELNLVQADFHGKIVIDNFTMFGGTKLIVPADWDVQSEVVAIFGGVDDKRPPATHHDPTKVLFLEGTCMMGGIEIRSF
jgi:predicted membrane protein